jgi:1-acyl-sn-glycerol-3-phosphate acyltransferase
MEEKRADSVSNRAASEPIATQLVSVVEQLLGELYPQRALPTVHMDSDLGRDLSIDSLGRVELISRLEETFRVRLPEELLGKAGNVRDLMLAVEKAGPRDAPAAIPTVERPASTLGAATPVGAPTLTEVLDWHVERQPERPHILLWEPDAGETTITYGRLAERARAVAGGLREKGVERGDRVAIMLPTGAEFFEAFFGALYAGGVPVPIYPPFGLSKIEEHLLRQAAILDNSQATVLITFSEAQMFVKLLKSRVSSLRVVETVSKLRIQDARGLPRLADTEQIALLQYTSGSTGDPSGVVLRHRNLLSNIRAMAEASQVTSSDVIVSWLPLYHDMGLIGTWLGSLYVGCPLVIMSPLTFLARPANWLWAIHRHRGTFSAAPNFAFELCLGKIPDRDLEGLDLSSLRTLANGAEPVLPQTIRRFTERFAKYGLRPEAIAPVYGLAENSVGLAFPRFGHLPLIQRVQRDALTTRQKAIPAEEDDANALEFVSCGRPLPGHEIRIVDSAGTEAAERQEGDIEFRGPSAASEYFRNPLKTRELKHGNWIRSGDRGYVADGELFVTGRAKDIIIRAGRNIYPHAVEAAVGEIGQVRKGCVVVFGTADSRSATERIVVVAETRESDKEELERLRRRIEEVTAGLLETPADEVILVPPRALPKTSSGKIRRSAARELYETNQLGTRKRAAWLQVTRLALGGMLQSSKRWLSALARVFYAGYWWLVMALIVCVSWLLVLILPRYRWRYGAIHRLGRLALWLTVTPLRVQGLEHLPKQQGILVANHASYADGLVLAAALPIPMRFVAKKELERQFFAGTFLRRIRTSFVDRIDPENGVEDSRNILEAARRHEPLVFFPEGTFTRKAGLLEFRLGAFLIGARAGVPIVPVTLTGTRSILRDESWFPSRGEIRVEVAPPLMAENDGFQAAIRLRDTARAEILKRCGEPDLVDERVTLANAD